MTRPPAARTLRYPSVLSPQGIGTTKSPRIGRTTTRPECRFMHCLPVRRGVAVTDRVLDGPRSVVVHEAENRMWGQMAVLYQMMGPGA